MRVIRDQIVVSRLEIMAENAYNERMSRVENLFIARTGLAKSPNVHETHRFVEAGNASATS